MSQFLGFSVLFGALLALIIAIGQMLRASKNKNHLIIGPLMFTVALWQGHTGLLVSNTESILTDILSFLLIPASFSFLPLYHAYGNRILSPEYSVEWSVSMAFFIFAFGVVIESIGVMIFPRHWILAHLMVLSGFSRVMTILLSLNLIRLSLRLKTDRKINNFREIRMSILLLTSMTIIGTSVSFYAQIVGQLKSDLHAAGALFVSITIVLLYFLNERNQTFLNLEHTYLRDRKMTLGHESIDQLESIIGKLMKEEAIYRTEELNITQFTDAVNQEGYKVTKKQISEYINIKYKRNFNVWINEYRIDEACKRLRDEKEVSILNIAYSVGFNSKSTFNSIFKLSRRMTPKEYRNQFGQ